MRTWIRGLLSALLVLLVLVIYLLLTIKPRSTRVIFQNNMHPWVIAHRGGAGLAPENSMVAFRNAVSLGVDMLEMDIHMTKDGHLVVIHDKSVDRTTNGHGLVKEMTLSEIRHLDAGYRFTIDGGATFPYRGKSVTIPTLKEVLAAFPAAKMSIEIKPDDIAVAEALASLIRAQHAENRVVVVSFHREVLTRFRALSPETATGASKLGMELFWVMQKAHLWRLYRPVPDVLQVPIRYGGHQIVTPGFIAAAHRQGMKVQVWTVDDPAVMRTLIGEGVDGIITNRPDLMLALLKLQ